MRWKDWAWRRKHLCMLGEGFKLLAVNSVQQSHGKKQEANYCLCGGKVPEAISCDIWGHNIQICNTSRPTSGKSSSWSSWQGRVHWSTKSLHHKHAVTWKRKVCSAGKSLLGLFQYSLNFCTPVGKDISLTNWLTWTPIGKDSRCHCRQPQYHGGTVIPCPTEAPWWCPAQKNSEMVSNWASVWNLAVIAPELIPSPPL